MPNRRRNKASVLVIDTQLQTRLPQLEGGKPSRLCECDLSKDTAGYWTFSEPSHNVPLQADFANDRASFVIVP